jgi:hypothetical protein
MSKRLESATSIPKDPLGEKPVTYSPNGTPLYPRELVTEPLEIVTWLESRKYIQNGKVITVSRGDTIANADAEVDIRPGLIKAKQEGLSFKRI